MFSAPSERVFLALFPFPTVIPHLNSRCLMCPRCSAVGRVVDSYILTPLEDLKKRMIWEKLHTFLPLRSHSRLSCNQPSTPCIQSSQNLLVLSSFSVNCCDELGHHFLRFYEVFQKHGCWRYFLLVPGKQFLICPSFKMCLSLVLWTQAASSQQAAGSKSRGALGLHKRLRILLFSCQVLCLLPRQPGENSLGLCAQFPTPNSSWKKTMLLAFLAAANKMGRKAFLG